MRRGTDPLARFRVHTIQVEARTGQDVNGVDVYATPVPVACFLEETNRLVRSPNGAEVVSTVQAYTAPGTTVALDSRVTLPSGRAAQLISIDRHDSAALGLPDHVTLNLE